MIWKSDKSSFKSALYVGSENKSECILWKVVTNDSCSIHTHSIIIIEKSDKLNFILLI